MANELSGKANEIRAALRSLGRRLGAGDDSAFVAWVIPGRLACAHRPLRHHPKFGGSRRDLPPEATGAVVRWMDRVVAEGFRSIICLMHPKEIAHYAALELQAPDPLAFYASNDLQACHKPWEDPAYRLPGERATFADELQRVQVEVLERFDRLPKPVLLHCSVGIDRSSPVAAFIWSKRSSGVVA